MEHYIAKHMWGHYHHNNMYVSNTAFYNHGQYMEPGPHFAAITPSSLLGAVSTRLGNMVAGIFCFHSATRAFMRPGVRSVAICLSSFDKPCWNMFGPLCSSEGKSLKLKYTMIF